MHLIVKYLKLKDKRIEAAQALIESGKIKNLASIFKVVPLSVIQKEIGMHYHTLHRRVYKPQLLTTDNYISMANVIGVKPQDLFNLALADIDLSPGKS